MCPGINLDGVLPRHHSGWGFAQASIWMGFCPGINLDGVLDGVLPGHLDEVLPGHLGGVLPMARHRSGWGFAQRMGFCNHGIVPSDTKL